MWKVFNSLNATQFNQIQELYEKGQLGKFGIDAHPLLDKITSANFGKEVPVQKGDNISELLEKAGHKLTYSKEDSLLLGLHLLLNAKLLAETQKKAEAAGLVTPSVMAPKEVLNLVTQALLGNGSSSLKLSQMLSLLPTGPKFRLLAPNEVKEFEKYFNQ